MRTGIPEVDELIRTEERVEFFGSWNDVLLLAHRTAAISAPISVVIVQEFGRLDPFTIKRFQRILQNSSLIYVKRAFKAEDVAPTIDSVEGEVIVIDPYHHGKLFTKISSSLRRRAFVFTREINDRPYADHFNLHEMNAIIRVKKGYKGYLFQLIKHPSRPYSEIRVSIHEMLGKAYSPGLLQWA
ncbi:hypothetical protein HS7_00670 [Sulfolobales archaeon HS-7]|nr:hypothetical protein HS7_00670 [Sulfolobales archaeon HS-7]